MVKIYQLEWKPENYKRRFASYEQVHAMGETVNKSMYICAYNSPAPADITDVDELLEHLYYIYNMERPEDFTGHSMSVSDVVEIDGKAYYCDPAGWVELGKEWFDGTEDSEGQ